LNLTPSPNATTDSDYSIRIGWQTEGQPAQQLPEDVIFIRAITVDDAYNRVRDRNYDDYGDPNVQEELTQYTRVWEVFWECTGPNSFDNARKIRSSLFWQNIRFMLAQANLYPVPDWREPQRVPEQRDGQWWPRTDFSARFNEFVTEEYDNTYVTSAEVIVENSQGVIAQFWVPPLPSVPQIDISANSGNVSSPGNALSVSGVVNEINIDSAGPITATGTLQIGPMQLASGSLEMGGTFAAGALVNITINSAGGNFQYSAITEVCTWTKINLAGGEHAYELTGSFISQQGNGAFVLLTATIGMGLWSGFASIQSLTANTV